MKKQKNDIRRIMAQVMILVMVVTMLGGTTSIPARADGGAYPYMIFAASDEDGAVTLSSNNTGLNGSIATNGTITVIGGNCNINGTRTECAGESGEPIGMPDLREWIGNTYFAVGTEEHMEDYALEETNINVNTPIEGEGKVSLSGNINLNAGIMAQEDIVFDGDVKNTGDVVLYSASGNVVISSTNVNLNGLVYAPYGEIRITSMNVNMNNVILIAQKVTIEANGINGGMNQGMAQFIGTEYNVIDDGTGNNQPVSPENPDPEEPDPVEPENPRDPGELMQGIVRYEATEGLEDIGEAYFKDIRSMDEIGYTIEGYPCVKNQLLLTSEEGISFAQVEELVHSYDAEIVGYLELTDDYQIEFYEDIAPETLRLLREEFARNELIRRCDYNLSAEVDYDFKTTDDEWGNQSWNSLWPSGNNWNIEMIDLEGALVNAGVISANSANAELSDLSGLTTVKIGLIDSAFDIWHEDMNYVTVWNNYTNPTELRTAASLSENETLNLYHGSHVAGIMAAGYNNERGITGICLKPFLYGFSMRGDSLSYVAAARDTTMKLQYALDLMIGNRVRVINYSMGYGTYAFAASQQEQYAIDFLDERTDKIDDFLGGLIDKGYDFLIVTSAGNANNQQFYKYTPNQDNAGEQYVSVADYNRSENKDRDYPNTDTNITYGAPNSRATISCNEVDARYDCEFSYSQNSRIQERVIVVGALAKPSGNQGKYEVTDFSNTGSRVNILAPGDAILSCMISGMGQDYDYKSGTSMASPHVAGVAGLAYNVNPNLSAAELKDIIINNATLIQDSSTGADIMTLNAADVIAAVVQNKIQEEAGEYTIQLHVTDVDGNAVCGAAVEVHNRDSFHHKVAGVMTGCEAVGDTVLYSGRTDAAGNIKLNIPQGNFFVLVDGEKGSVIQTLSVSDADIIEKPVKEVMISDYLQEGNCSVVLQFRSSSAKEYVNSAGYIIDAEIRFIKGWMDASGIENLSAENYVTEAEVTAGGGQSAAVYYPRTEYGYINARLGEGSYTVEVTLPDEEPQYYHIILSGGAAVYCFRL